jgi:hypothetical protein
MALTQTLPRTAAKHDQTVFSSRGEIRSIVFPEDGRIRSRKVVTRSRARSTGKYPSWKMGRMMQWESTHELNAFRILDCDPAVLRFVEQPCEICYIHDGLEKTHYPDILVEYRDHKELWEVKSDSDAAKAEFIQRTTILDGLASWGYRYRVALARELKAQPRLMNAMQLAHFGRREVTVQQRESIRVLLSRCVSLTWGNACLGDYGDKGREALCRLVLEGKLSFDLSSSWSPDSKFQPVEAL